MKIRELVESISAQELRDIQDSIALMMKLAPDVHGRFADKTGFSGTLHTMDGPHTDYFVYWKDGQWVVSYTKLDKDVAVERYDDEENVIDRLKQLDKQFKVSRKPA